MRRAQHGTNTGDTGDTGDQRTQWYDPRVAGVGPGNAPDPGSIVVAESRWQSGVLFGFLLLAFIVALSRGVTSAQTASGRAAVVIICGILIVFFVRGWIMIIRRPARLEVTADAVRFVQRNGHLSVLSRASGNELQFVKQHRGALSRVWTLGVTIVGTDTVITLPGFFSRTEIRRACQERGWRFDETSIRRR